MPASRCQQKDTDSARHGAAMRFYLLLGLLFVLVIFDITQNRGQMVRLVGGWFGALFRAIGLL